MVNIFTWLFEFRRPCLDHECFAFGGSCDCELHLVIQITDKGHRRRVMKYFCKHLQGATHEPDRH